MSSTNRGAKRRERDNYPTPAWCVEALIPEIVWGDIPRVLEPCVGTGVVLDTIRSRIKCQTHGFDIAEDNAWGLQADFLKYEDYRLERWDFIITNPPFTLAQEFIDKSLELANCVIMLLPQSFFGSEKRKEWWKKHPPTAQFILSKRPSFTGDGKTDSEVYSWVVFDSTGRQKKGWYWL